MTDGGRSRRGVLAAVSGTLLAAAAGCLSGGGAPTPTSGGTDGAAGTVTGDEASGAPTVVVRPVPDLGEVLAAGNGMTLYMYRGDTRDEAGSACTGACAETWPPLTVRRMTPIEKGEGVTAGVGQFPVSPTMNHVTAGGWPLYFYAEDGTPGEARGHGVDGHRALRPDGSPIGR